MFTLHTRINTSGFGGKSLWAASAVAFQFTGIITAVIKPGFEVGLAGFTCRWGVGTWAVRILANSFVTGSKTGKEQS